MQHDLVASQGGEGYDNTGRFLQIIGLNPSTADETKDDPTIRRCIGFAKRWGFGGLCMTNLFAYRATKPSVMKAVSLFREVYECGPWAPIRAQLREQLRGKNLACWCPLGSPCHADVLLELANA